jgi:transcriptional regulator with XRE-family HTH domain
MNSHTLVQAARTRNNLPTNEAVARLLGVPSQSVQRWNTGKHTPDDVTAANLADLAGLDRDVVLAAMQAQRSSTPAERSLWEQLAKRLQGSPSVALAAAVGAILSLLFGGGPDGGATLVAGALLAADVQVYPLYIVRSLAPGFAPLLCLLLCSYAALQAAPALRRLSSGAALPIALA